MSENRHVALWFHLSHGFWSAMQTFGWNGKVWFCRWKVISRTDEGAYTTVHYAEEPECVARQAAPFALRCRDGRLAYQSRQSASDSHLHSVICIFENVALYEPSVGLHAYIP